MNPNVNMANINPMGGPVGGVPMMNNGAMNQQAAAAAAAANAARQQQANDSQRGVLNTYIYEYFLHYGMYECARSVIASGQPVNVQKDGPKTGGAVNGVSEDGMDTDMKDDPDTKHPDDLPPPKLPMPANDSSFLYEWFCLFWDIYYAQRAKGGNGNVNQYVAHTQNQQQELLRGMRADGITPQQYQQMMRSMHTGAAMNMPMKGPLSRTAIANSQNSGMMMHSAKQNPMQRDPSQMDPSREQQSSPAAGENAPSPSKRQRPNDFNPNAAVSMMPNGRPGQGMPQQPIPGASNAAAAQMLTAHNINPAQLAANQFNNFVNIPPTAQQKSIAAYSQHLQHHHGNQMGTKQPNAGPPGQGSPMMAPGPDGTNMNYTYNPNGEIPTPNGLRGGPPGNGQAAGGSNHALQDYQMQLMLLEQQNKKRLMMARQEQDNIGGVREGQAPGAAGPGAPGGPGVPNGQPFPEASPQTMRTGASPNPTEQMKRGTPQMNNPGIPSPAPEGGPQSRGSPNPAMNFMGNADPNMAPHFFKGADGNMAGAQAPMNGMRPPSSHPGQAFNGQMTPQMMAARQQAQGQQAGQNPQQWQGPNNQMVPAQNMQQNPQLQGTPGQRSMPPPSAPVAAAANANNRTTASPQQSAAAPPTPNQSNKAAPKKKETKAAKDKRVAAQKNKPNSNLNGSGATPAADNNGDSEQGAPATPITPVTAPGFKPGQNANAANSQPSASSAAPPTAVPAPQPPIAQQSGPDPNSIMENFPIDFGGPLGMGGDGIHTGDVLNDFDFDSFLHDGDGDNQPFDFNGAFTSMEGEIGAE